MHGLFLPDLGEFLSVLQDRGFGVGWEEFLLSFSQHITVPCHPKSHLSAILIPCVCHEIAPSV